MANLRIGTCSWKYDSWRNLLYSQNENINYLQEYSQKYNTVEIDQWFWSLHDIDKVTLPAKHVVEEYAASVPDDFTFSIKVPNSITLTHFYNRTKSAPLRENPYFLSAELFEKFIESLQPLKSKLGPLMFQFEYLNKQKMSSQKTFQDRFSEFAKNIPKGYTYAIEIRNPNYLNAPYFYFLNDNNLRHVFLQGYYMPAITNVFLNFASSIKNETVLRLHGPDRKGIEKKTGRKWDQIVENRDDEILAIVRMIQQLLDKDISVYVNVNNHYEGSAPLTIERIQSRISQ